MTASGVNKSLFYTLVFLLPASSLYIDVGVTIPIWKIVLLYLLPWSLFFWLNNGASGRVQLLLVLVLFYVFLVSVVSGLIGVEPIYGKLEFREEWRWLIQFVSLLLSISIFFVTLHFVKTGSDFLKALRTYILAAYFLAILGIIQWFIQQFLGMTILGIYREGFLSGESANAFFLIGSEKVYRANSLCREPKDLALILCMAIMAIITLNKSGTEKIKGHILFIILVGLLVTFSTTGFVLLVLIFMFMYILFPFMQRKTNHGVRKSRGVLLLIVILSVISFSTGVGSRIFEERISDRVMLEEYDSLTLHFLEKNPWYALTGVGAGMLPFYANEYIPADPVYSYMHNYTWDAKAGILKWVASYGLLCTALLFWAFLRIGKRLFFLVRTLPDDQKRIASTALVLFVFAISVQCLRSMDDLFWLFSGLAVAMIRSFKLSSSLREKFC